MAVYQVSIKKRVHRHEWANQYIIVLDTPFSRDELDYIADSVPPRLISFERIFLSEEVELLHAEITPICQPPEPWMAWRAADSQSHIPRSIAGLRPMAIEETTGPAVTLVLGLQPTANHWGRKDYRYALHRDEVQISSRGYHLHIHAQKEMDLRLSQAKLQIKPFLEADHMKPSLAVSASREPHLVSTYQYRRVRNITIKGVHIYRPHK